MKILFVMTGGTICSYRNEDGQLSSDARAAAPVILDRFWEDGGVAGVEFDVRHVLNVLSENMTFARLDRLLGFFRGLTADELDGCGGIIVAHGTDTLAYTSSLLALALAGFRKPVFIVSSDYTLNRPEANGHVNFRAAVRMIADGFGCGVYVPYLNSDGVVYLHYGAQLEQCRNFTNDFFSCGMTPVDEAAAYSCQVQTPPVLRLSRLQDCVLKVDPYVGLDYSAVRPSGNIRAVLHGSYHSSTACVERSSRNEPFTRFSALCLIQYCKEHGIDFWLSGLPESENLLDGAYSTCADLILSGAKPVAALTNETAYMKLTLAYSLGCKVDSFMVREIASEKTRFRGSVGQ